MSSSDLFLTLDLIIYKVLTVLKVLGIYWTLIHNEAEQQSISKSLGNVSSG